MPPALLLNAHLIRLLLFVEEFLEEATLVQLPLKAPFLIRQSTFTNYLNICKSNFLISELAFDFSKAVPNGL